MAETIRVDVSLNLEPGDLEAIDQLARECNTARNGLVLQALGFFQVAHRASKEGKFVGVTPYRDRLETVIAGSLVWETAQ